MKARLALASMLATASFAQSPFSNAVQISRSTKFHQALSLADVTGDGLVDVLVTWGFEDGLSLHPGLASGGFGQPVRMGRDLGPILELAPLDADGDGDLDLACATTSGSIELLRNTDGRLVGGTGWPALVGVTNVTKLHAQDLNGDGLADLLICRRATTSASFPNSLIWHRTTGSEFDSVPTPVLTGPFTGLQLQDIDGDSLRDVTYYDRADQRIEWRRGLPGGNFATNLPIANVFGVINSNQQFAVLDADADGDMDFVRRTDSVVLMAIQDPVGVFQPAAAVALSAVMRWGITIQDYNADGFDDIGVTRRGLVIGTHEGRIFLSDGLGGFSAQGGVLHAGLTNQNSAAAETKIHFADVNADGRPDAVTGVDSTDIFVVPSQPGTAIQFDPVFPIGAERMTPYALATADIDLDGDQDLLTYGSIDGVTRMVTYVNDGGLAFQDARMLWSNSPADSPWYGISVGDFDGDGADDILSGVSPSFGTSRLYLRLGNGAGGFGPPAFDMLLPTAWYGFVYDDPVDLNQDGRLDALVYESNNSGSGPQLVALMSSGTGLSFQSVPVLSHAPLNIRTSPQVIDMNGDGRLDVVMGTPSGVFWAPQTSAGTFGPQQSFPPTTSGAGIPVPLVGDWNSDGHPDVLMDGNPIATFLGSASGTGGMPLVSAIDGAQTWCIRIPMDANLDGALDFVVQNTGTGPQLPEIFLGDASGQIVARQLITSSSDSSIFSIARDLDLDGDLDLVQLGTNIDVLPNESVRNVGVNYCGPAAVNSSGGPGRMAAYGEPSTSFRNLRLRAEGLPRNRIGFFVGSRTRSMPTAVPGSLGLLCLGGNIGRYIGLGQILSSGAGGRFEIPLNPTLLREGGAFTAATVGSTWSFQAWFMDVDQGITTSNLTDVLTLTFE